ncbi:hypothetical protein QQS21_007648 [Conoideocrella luteorostrata]|uniref:CENP-T/Histone H4 histone fold domain-containing protein n=1 Tax=Conoideocrella luteorostrata TaxID=1105319 RepID=A0AAJ0FS86_9HYPO|nr:hypothetical protein QQS21_007648 [Conoideocrella luteorostrata]
MDSSPSDANSSRTKTPSRTPAPARTPVNRRAVSAEPPSSHPSALRTPLDRSSARDLLNSVRRGVSASGGRRDNAPTPHAVAARRALDQRRTALLTPGRARRLSLREQRETPMEDLRNLGKVLAANTRPITSSSPRDKSSAVASVLEESEDGDDDLPIQPPRLSLPIDEDDDSELVPPLSTGLEDDTNTILNVELPRRERPDNPGRLSGFSLGSRRDTDAFPSDDYTEIDGRQSDFFPGFVERIQAGAYAAADTTLNRIDMDDRRTTLGQRESDFGLEIPADVADQTDFVMSEPRVDGGDTSPFQERSVVEASAYNAANTAGLGDVTLGSTVGKVGGDDLDTYDDRDPDPVLDEADDAHFAREDRMAAEEQEEADGGAEPTDESITGEPSSAVKPRQRLMPKKRQRRISKYGIEYPPLPPSFVKRVAQTALHSSGLSNPRVSTDTVTALTQASEWFFEQLGDDLGAYANHAARKIIEESDVATLMRRQRQITSDATMFSLAQRYLPRELLQELKMTAPVGGKIPRKRRRQDEEETEESSEVTWTQSS